jgi:hypothetical protein
MKCAVTTATFKSQQATGRCIQDTAINHKQSSISGHNSTGISCPARCQVSLAMFVRQLRLIKKNVILYIRFVNLFHALYNATCRHNRGARQLKSAPVWRVTVGKSRVGPRGTSAPPPLVLHFRCRKWGGLRPRRNALPLRSWISSEIASRKAFGYKVSVSFHAQEV